jgi:hypothetical protein
LVIGWPLMVKPMLLQVVALGRGQADVGRAGVAGQQVAEALLDLQVTDEAALRGAEGVGALHVEHGEHIEAVGLQVARCRR